MDSLRISLQSILSNIEDVEDKCVDRLVGSLKNRDGITAVEVTEDQNCRPQLLVKFDADIISNGQIQHITRETGKKLDKTIGHLRIKVQEVQDTQRIQATTTLLKKLKGVMNVLVVPAGWIILEFNQYIIGESILRELVDKMNLVV